MTEDDRTRFDRSYQTEAFARWRGFTRAGFKRCVLVSPTGSGKTYMGARLCEDEIRNKGARVAWMVHRAELATQAIAQFERLGLHCGFGFQGRDLGIQVHTVQSLLARGEAPEADLVVFDEAHHYAADEWGRLVSVYSQIPMLGLTATPERGDGRPLSPPFEKLITVTSTAKLVESGYLAPCKLVQASRVQGGSEIAMSPVDAYLRYTERGRAVVFAGNVAQCAKFRDEFKTKGIPAAIVTGEMQPADRKAALDGFAAGHYRALINVYVLTEGWDCPPCDVCIVARKVAFPGMWLQMIGRIRRIHKDKSYATLIDLVGASWVHGLPDAEREYFLEGEPIRQCDVTRLNRTCRVCKTPMQPGQTTCMLCNTIAGFANSDITVSGDPMIEIHWTEFKKTEAPQLRIRAVAQWIVQQEARKFKVEWVFHKYRAVYSEEMPRYIMQGAREELAKKPTLPLGGD